MGISDQRARGSHRSSAGDLRGESLRASDSHRKEAISLPVEINTIIWG